MSVWVMVMNVELKLDTSVSQSSLLLLADMLGGVG